MSSVENNANIENLPPAQRVKSDWRSLVEKVSYAAVVSNIPFLSFLMLLCVLYISNNHRAIDIQRQINLQTKNLKELRWKYMDTKSQLLTTKSELVVMDHAKALGLKESLMPAYKIGAKK